MGALLASFTEGDEEVGVVRVAPCAHAPGGDVVLGGNLGGSEARA